MLSILLQLGDFIKKRLVTSFCRKYLKIASEKPTKSLSLGYTDPYPLGYLQDKFLPQ
jgi:hypothetical protein